MKILYVEDEERDVVLTQRQLAKTAPHIQLDLAHSLQEARSRIQAVDYELVLCDLHLPDGDGLELLSEIRERALPLAVVILTGQGDEDIAISALKAGADDYLTKKKDYLSRLPAVLDAALRRFRSEAERKTGKLRVLYIEHDRADIDLTRRHLEKFAPHIRLEVASSFQSVRERLPKTPGEGLSFDVLLADFRMPGENALEFVKTIRDERQLDLPVVLVSGHGDEETIAAALRLGVSDYLVKHPNYLYALPSVLENAYHRARLEREQHALRESETRYRLMVENSTFGIVVHVDQQIVFANRTAASVIGAASPDDLLGRNIFEFVHPDERQMILELVLQSVGSTPAEIPLEAKIVEERLIRLDGTTIYAEASAIPVEYYGKQALLVMLNDITGRKQAEQKIQESEAKFRSYIEHAPLPFFVLKDSGEILEINRAAEDLLGYPLAALRTMNVLEMANPDDRRAVSQVLSSVIEKGYLEGEYRLKERGGEMTWIDLRAVRLGGNQILAFWEDISERKAAEQALQEKARLQEQLAKIAETVPGMISSLRLRPDGSSCMPYSTQALDDLYGLQPEDVLEDATPALSLIDPEDMLHVQRAMNESASHLTPFWDEWRVHHPRRGVIWVEGHTMPVREPDGSTLWHGFIQDITERKLAEQELKDREARYRAVIETSQDGFWVIDDQGRFLEVNDAYVKLSGYTRGELLSMRIADVEIAESPEETLVHIRNVMENGRDQFETRHRKKSGEIWDVEINVAYWGLRGERLFVFIRDITHRKRSEEALRQSEERYRSLFEQLQESEQRFALHIQKTPVAVIEWDLQHRVAKWNPAAEKIFGYPAEQAIGQHANFLIAEESIPHIETIWEELISLRGGERSINENITRDGRTILCEWHNTGLSTPDGKLIGVASMAQDITEKVTAENALRESEERFRTLASSIDDAIIITDWDQKIIFWNKGAERQFGYGEAEVLGQPPRMLVPEPFLGPHLAATGQFRQRRAAHTTGLAFEAAGLRKDGAQFPVDVSMCTWGDDKELYTGTIIRDITERKRAEAELIQHRDHLEELVSERTARLAESEASLRKYSEEIIDLYHNAPCGYHSIDGNGVIVRMNNTELGWLGYTSDEVIGVKTLKDLLAPESAARFEKAFPEFMKRGSLQNMETVMVRKDGSLLPVLINATALYDENGAFVMSRETLLDNTERIQAENALRESKEAAESANRAKSTFLANMSHEIRTPMNAILGFAQLMMREPGLSAAQEKHLGMIHRSGEHLLELINEILEMSKIEANRVALDLTTFDLPTMIHELEMMFKLRTEDKGLCFTIDLSPDLPRYVVTDANKLRQIFINLLGNAVKFTRQGGIRWRVRTATRETGGLYLESEVEDSGPGIALEEIDLLFQAFGQTSTGIRQGGGTGLGLAISSRYARMLGGSLSVTSRLQRGTTFRLEIEVGQGKKDEIAPERPARQVTRLKEGQPRYRLLVVDDQAENRLLLTEILGKAGFDMREAANGQEAVDMTAQWAPQLILMDMRMPVMGGEAAIRQIKASEKGRDIPIIAVTASAFSEDEARVMQVGASAYIRKPFDHQDIYQAIATCLNVQYEYEIAPLKEKSPGSEATPAPGREGVTALPKEFTATLRQAILTANLNEMLRLIDGIEKEYPQIAAHLRDLATQFQYDDLLALLQAEQK